MKAILFAYLLFCCSLSCYSSLPDKFPLEPLRSQLTEFLKDIDGEVGIGLIAPNGDTLNLNNSIHYPLMSVMKWHQSVAVAEVLRRQQIPLDSSLYISAEEMATPTYSPLRDRFPQGNCNKTIRELLTLTLQLSDNIACDVLFKQILSPKETQEILQQKTGIQDFQIRHNETEMQALLPYCYENWSTPSAAVQLLRDFHEGNLVTAPYRTFIENQMTHCQTGREKLIRPLLKRNAIVGHKTGGGPQTPCGRCVANNDLAFIQLPNGTTYYLAVFIKDAAMTLLESDQLMACISQIVFDHFSSDPSH